ncbi:MAG: ABC transporter ATP-binding protein [Candidatus Binatia bacterium]
MGVASVAPPDTETVPRRASTPVIAIAGVSKRYRLYHRDRDRLVEWLTLGRAVRHRDFYALRDVSLEVPRGETLGVVGVNGSGKSTLLQLMAGILRPDAGTVRVDGRVTALLELGAGFHSEFTGRENVFLYGQILGISRDEMAQRFEQIVAFAEIGDFLDQPVKTYSSGMVVRLAFAVAVNVDPEVMLVDEALAVGDFRFQRKSYNQMKALRDRCTFIVVSHSSQVLMRICDRVAWLHGGHLMDVGDPERVIDDYERHVEGGEPSAPRERQPVGSGEVVVARVDMFDGDGRPCTTFPPDAAVGFRVTCTARQPVEHPVVGILVYDADHRRVWGANTYWDEVPLPHCTDRLTLEYHIPQLPLLPGRYDVCVAVADSEGAVAYDWHDSALRFSIRDPRPGPNVWARGIVNVKGRWKVSPSGGGR